MNWDVHLQLDILFTTANNGQMLEKSTARIHVFQTDTRMFRWVQEGGPVRGVPAGGFWEWKGGGNGNLTLVDEGRQPFVTLTPFTYPPGEGGQGAIYVAENRRTPTSPGQFWKGTGKWTLATGKPQNTPEAVLDSITWANFIRGFGRIGQLTDWKMVSSRGFSATAGVGGKFGGEFARGGVQLENLKRPKSAPVWMDYTSLGIGYMLEGAGVSGGTEEFPTFLKTILTLGTLPTETPLELTELEGFCQIVDLSAAFVMSKQFKPLLDARALPMNRGVGASLLMVIFGVPAGLALGAYKAAGLVVGGALATGTSGKSAGATLQAGRIHIAR